MCHWEIHGGFKQDQEQAEASKSEWECEVGNMMVVELVPGSHTADRVLARAGRRGGTPLCFARSKLNYPALRADTPVVHPSHPPQGIVRLRTMRGCG